MPRAVVRTTRDRRLLDEWSLVLSAAGIEHDTASSGGTFTLTVDDALAAPAVVALSGYDDERRRRSTRRWVDVERRANAAWLVPAAILLGYMWTGPVQRGTAPFQDGAAIATRILDGELWRTATALTLHADGLHAASNAASALIFLLPLCRILGGGSAFALSVYAGMLATWINAWLRGPGYAGIGASTAVFAAVGLLAGLRIGRDEPRPLWRRLGPFGAALGILAMLGASPETDIVAHLLGLAVGAGAGAVFACGRDTALEPTADAALGASAVVALIVAWLLAWVV